MNCKIFLIFINFNFQNNKIVLYLHSQPEMMRRSNWRNGRAVECGSLENC